MIRNELLKIRGINNKFQFGKYKVKTLLYVLDNNPQYIIWCQQVFSENIMVKEVQIEEKIKININVKSNKNTIIS